MDENLKEWKVLVACCHSLSLFNRFVLPLMRVEEEELMNYAATEAKRRGYKPNKTTGKYEEP